MDRPDGESGVLPLGVEKQGAADLVLVALADLFGEQAIERDGHDGELEIDVELERQPGGQRVHVEKGGGVLDQHAPGIAVDQPVGGSCVWLVSSRVGLSRPSSETARDA